MKKVFALQDIVFRSYKNLHLAKGQEAEVPNHIADQAEKLGLVKILGDGQEDETEGNQEESNQEDTETQD